MKNFMPKRKTQFRTAWKIKACIHLYPQLVNFEKRSQQKNNSGFYLPLGAKPICHQTGDYCYFLSEKFMENEEHEENETSMAIEVYRQLALISTSASLSAISLASSGVNGGGRVHGSKLATCLSIESIMQSRCRPWAGHAMDSVQISMAFSGTVGLYWSSLAYSVSRWSM